LRRLGISPEEILQEFLSEQLKTSQSSVSTSSSNITSATSSVGTSSISSTVIASIIIVVVAIAGIGGTCVLGIICPSEVPSANLVYPLNNLEDVSTVNFEWDVRSNKDKVEYYKLEITDEDTGIIERKSVNDNLYSKDLDVGKYSWRVIVVDNTGIFSGIQFVSANSNSNEKKLKVDCGDTVYTGYTENQLPDSWSSAKKSNYLAKSTIGCIA